MMVLSAIFWFTVVSAPAQEAPAGAEADDYRYYVAALAAANACFELHDTVAVRHWLEEAPAQHRGWEWEYLKTAADRSAGSFEAHRGPITDMSVSPDGQVLATAGDNDVMLWSVDGGTRLGALAGHTAAVWNARFAPDGRRIATVASDGTLRIWDPRTGDETMRVEGIGSGVAGAAWSPDGNRVATVSWKHSGDRGVFGVIDVWDAASGERIQHLDHGVKPIGSANYAPDGSRLYVGTWDFDVGAYDTRTWKQLFRLHPVEDDLYKRIAECRPSPDGSLFAAAHADGKIRIWDTASAKLLNVLHRQAEGAYLAQNDVVWFPDSRRIAAGSADLTVRIWDAAAGRHLLALHGHAAAVTALAMAPDALTLFSGDAGGIVNRWDLVELAPERCRWELPGCGYSVAVARDGSRAASAGWGGWIVILDQRSGSALARWDGHGQSGVRAAFDPSGAYLATTGNDQMVKVWDLRESPPALLFETAAGMQSLAVEFSADGRWLAAPADRRALKVWAMPGGEEAAALDEGIPFSDAAWHPAKNLLAAADEDGVLRLWDPAAGQVTARLEGHGTGALQAAFSSDGEKLAGASASGTIQVWDLESARLLSKMSVTNGGQFAAAFSPDGSRLATGGYDNQLHIWDPAGAHLLQVQFSNPIWDLAWSADGDRLFALPLDGTIRVLHRSKKQGF